LHARFTSNATITIKINNAVGTGVKRGGWTNFHTRRIGAMVTTVDRKFPSVVRKFTLFDIFHMGAIDTNGNIKFTFTRHRAGMTANAHAVIYDKSVIQFFPFMALCIAAAHSFFPKSITSASSISTSSHPVFTFRISL